MDELIDNHGSFSLDAIYLAKHVAAMENLADAIRHLETLIEKVIALESQRPTNQLKETLTSFMEYQVNPRCYPNMNYLEILPSTSMIPSKPPSVNQIKTDATMDPEVKDLYKSILTKTLNVFL